MEACYESRGEPPSALEYGFYRLLQSPGRSRMGALREQPRDHEFVENLHPERAAELTYRTSLSLVLKPSQPVLWDASPDSKAAPEQRFSFPQLVIQTIVAGLMPV